MALLQLVDRYYTYSETEVSTTSGSYVDDTQASLSFTTNQTLVALIIYNASSRADANLNTTEAGGVWNAISVDGTDYAQSKCVGQRSGNTCFWIGSLSAGNHTIKGRFKCNTSGHNAYVGLRSLAVLLFTGDEFNYTENTTEVSTTSQSWVTDSYAQYTFTPSASCKLLVLYNIMNLNNNYADRGASGLQIAGSDIGVENSHFNAQTIYYHNSRFVSWAQSQSSSSVTVAGRYRTWMTTSAYVSRRQFGYLCLDNSVIVNTLLNTTTSTTFLTYPQEDPQVSINLSNPSTNTWLCLATRAGIYPDQITGQTTGYYGIKLGSTIKSRSFRAVDYYNYPIGTTALHCENLPAGNYTLKTVYGLSSGTGQDTISKRFVVSLLIPRIEITKSTLFTFHG